MNESVETQDKPSNKIMIMVAAILLFAVWYKFLSPWVQFQFWQSDTFWLIETGRLILEKHCLPTHDIYSFTASAPHWVVYQWLAEVIFSLANDVGGLTGISLVGEVLLAVLFCVLMFREMLKNGINAVVAVAVIWLSAYSFFPDLSSLRPQLFSFLLFWLLAVVCADIKAGGPVWKALARIFVIVVVWANCHISFIAGLVMLGANLVGSLLLYLLKKTDKRQPIVFAAAITTFVIATFFTPFGLSLWSFIFSVNNVYYTQEVLPLAWATQPRLVLLAIASLASFWYLAKKPDPGSILALLAMLLIGNNCGRLIIYFCILSCPAIGWALTQCLGKMLSLPFFTRFDEALVSVARSRFYVWGILLLSTCIVFSQPIFLRRNVPVQAAKFLADHPTGGNMFCTAHIGSYLIYSSHGAIPVFMDTRMDLYDPKFVERFAKALTEGVGWTELFAQYKIASALLPNGSRLQIILAGLPDWKQTYHDADFSLYSRNGGPVEKSQK